MFAFYSDLKSIELHTDLKQLGYVNGTELKGMKYSVYFLCSTKLDIPDVEGR